MHLNSSSLETQVDVKTSFFPYINRLHRHHKALADIVSYLDKLLYCSREEGKPKNHIYTIRLKNICRQTGYCMNTVRKWIEHLVDLGILIKYTVLGYSNKFEICSDKIKEHFGPVEEEGAIANKDVESGNNGQTKKKLREKPKKKNGQRDNKSSDSNFQFNKKGEGLDSTDTLSSLTDSSSNLPDSSSTLLDIYNSYQDKTNDNKEQEKKVFEKKSTKKDPKPKPKLKNQDPFKRGKKPPLIENQKSISNKDIKSTSKDKISAAPLKNKNQLTNSNTNLESKKPSLPKDKNKSIKPLGQILPDILPVDVDIPNQDNLDQDKVVQSKSTENHSIPDVNNGVVQELTEIKKVEREIQRQDYFDILENLKVKTDEILKDLCLRVPLSRLHDALEALKQQIENKRVNRQYGIAAGENVDDINNPNHSKYHLVDSREFFIKALEQGFKPNKRTDTYSNVQALAQSKIILPIRDIVKMYHYYDYNKLLEAVLYFGYTVDDLNNCLNDISDNKSQTSVPQLDDDGWPITDSEDINTVSDIDTDSDININSDIDTDSEVSASTNTDPDTDITIDINVSTDAITDSDLESKLVVDLSPQHFQVYMNRLRSCGVELDSFILELCSSYSVFLLDNAIQVLEQQIEKKEANRHYAQLIGQDVDSIDNPDYQRYHLKNPREFFITALRKGFKPNKSSERYSKLRSINEFKPKLTIKKIKEMYPKHKWLEAAEHFGYSANDLVD